MTMTTCRGCGQDVHITHSDDECPEDDADLRTPAGLRGEPAPMEGER